MHVEKRAEKKTRGSDRRQNIQNRFRAENASKIFNTLVHSLAPLAVNRNCRLLGNSDRYEASNEQARVIFGVEGPNNRGNCIQSKQYGTQFQRVDMNTDQHHPHSQKAKKVVDRNDLPSSASTTNIRSYYIDNNNGSDEITVSSSATEVLEWASDIENDEAFSINQDLGFEWEGDISVSQVRGIATDNDMEHFENKAEGSRILKQFDLLGELGKGAFGLVLKVFDKIDEREYALKIVPLTPKTSAFALEEPRLHSSLSPHPNICRYMTVWRENLTEELRQEILKVSSQQSTAFESESSIFCAKEIMVMQLELYEMNLKTFLTHMTSTTRDVTTCLRIFLDILTGLSELHRGSQGFLHRDLKPSNIFLKVSSVGRVIKASIGDFGISTRMENGFGEVGTSTYAAPEQKAAGQKYNEKADIYSLGLILFELFHPAWSTEMERRLDLGDVKKGKISDEFERKYPTVTALVKKCLHLKPACRPSILELYEGISGELDKYRGDCDRFVDDMKRDRLSLLRELKLLRKLVADGQSNKQ